MAVEDVLFRIRAIDKATKPIQKVRGQFKKTDDSAKALNKTVSGIGTTIKRAFAALAVFKVAKDVVTLGVNMEQTRVAFATFLGDAEKGNKLIAQLNEFANVTPFNNAEVIKSGRVLLSAGVAAEDVTRNLKNIGDVAAGANVPLEELAAIYSKSLNKGKLQAEELNQLSERGIPFLQALAKRWNITTAEVLKLGEQGKITSDVMASTFQEMTSEGGIFFNLMEKQSKTLGGRFSTLVGTLQTVGIGIGEALIGPLGRIVDSMQGVVKFFQENAAAIMQVFAPLGRAIQPFIDQVNALRARMTELGGGGSMLQNIFNVLGNTLLFLEPILTGIFTVMGKIIAVIFEVTVAIKNWISQSEIAKGVIAGLGTAFVNTFNLIKRAALDILGGVGDLITGIFNLDLDAIKSGLSQLGAGVLRGNPITAGLEAATSFEKGFKKGLEGSNIMDFFPAALSAPGQVATDLATSAAAGTSIAGAAGAATGATRGDLKAGISEVKAAAPKTFNINIEKLIEAFNVETTNMQQTPQRVADEVQKALLRVLTDANTLPG